MLAVLNLEDAVPELRDSLNRQVAKEGAKVSAHCLRTAAGEATVTCCLALVMCPTASDGIADWKDACWMGQVR